MSTENKSNTPAEIRDFWQTPRYIFNHYNERFKFTTDVAASKENNLCFSYIDEGSDALDYETPWGHVNWCNPPYSDIGPWVSRASAEMLQGRTTVMLIPADTSVKWFKVAFKSCTECHFISGRLAFINAETKKPVSGNNKGSVVFIFDPRSPFKSQVALIDRESMK